MSGADPVTSNPRGGGPHRRLHRFHGGLVLPGHRELTRDSPLRQAGIPPQLILPLLQHIGEAAECLVKPGERVLKGQVIATARGNVSAPVHASSSGTVVGIEERPYPHPSGFPVRSVVIETDGRDEWIAPEQDLAAYQQVDGARLLERIRNAGIVGLGGAGFPTQVKLGSSTYHNIELLVINGVECEPYLSCDERLMLERPAEVLEGIRILQHILGPTLTILALEDHMDAARCALEQELAAADNTDIELVSVPEIYPSGGERQLIRILTGKEVPSQGFPADIGILCQNVGTAAAVYSAVIHNRPLISRIVTVTGAGVVRPGNLEVLIGTPFRHALETCGGYSEEIDRLLMGGPMMGFTVSTDSVPVIKTTNCILAVSRSEIPPAPPQRPCIRCGKCTEVCPAELLPQQLYWYAQSGNLDAAQDYNLFDCIECGCCACVCPSHIPLVQYYRHSKAEIWNREKQKKAADIARSRHEARLARLERIRRERAERLARKKREVSGPRDVDRKKAAIQAALERVQQKKAQANITPRNVDNLSPEQQRRIREVEARRRHRQEGGQ